MGSSLFPNFYKMLETTLMDAWLSSMAVQLADDIFKPQN